MEKKPTSRKINLIPSDLAVPAKTVTLAKQLNKLSVVGSIVLAALAVVAVSVFTYFSLEYRELNRQTEDLKNAINSLQQNEQKLVLVKDRISKIKEIRSKNTLAEEISGFKNFSNNLSVNPDISFSDIKLDSKSSEVSVVSKTTEALSTIFHELQSTSVYSNIMLSSLGFNPNSGYIVSFIFE